jgi:predicted HicB family RNase H-like nuclease
MTTALQSGVRRKDEDKKKGKFTFSLDKGVYRALSERSDATGDSMSRIVEQALRQVLGLTKQPDPKDEQ